MIEIMPRTSKKIGTEWAKSMNDNVLWILFQADLLPAPKV